MRGTTGRRPPPPPTSVRRRRRGIVASPLSIRAIIRAPIPRGALVASERLRRARPWRRPPRIARAWRIVARRVVDLAALARALLAEGAEGGVRGGIGAARPARHSAAFVARAAVEGASARRVHPPKNLHQERRRVELLRLGLPP